MTLHLGEIRHLCCWYFFLSIPFFALLSWDFFSGAVYSLTMACKWKGKVFKQKLLSPWLQLQVILRQINFRKQFEHLEIDSLKNTWFWELHLKDNYYKCIKIRRMKIHNSLGPFGILMIICSEDFTNWHSYLWSGFDESNPDQLWGQISV